MSDLIKIKNQIINLGAVKHITIHEDSICLTYIGEQRSFHISVKGGSDAMADIKVSSEEFREILTHIVSKCYVVVSSKYSEGRPFEEK